MEGRWQPATSPRIDGREEGKGGRVAGNLLRPPRLTAARGRRAGGSPATSNLFIQRKLIWRVGGRIAGDPPTSATEGKGGRSAGHLPPPPRSRAARGGKAGGSPATSHLFIQRKLIWRVGGSLATCHLPQDQRPRGGGRREDRRQPPTSPTIDGRARGKGGRFAGHLPPIYSP